MAAAVVVVGVAVAGVATGQSCGSLDPSSDTFALCTCDLTQGECNQNCCCDVDCSAEDRTAFTGCQLVSPEPQRRCVYKDVIVRNNTQFTVDETNDDLFCVLVENSDGRTYFEQPCAPATVAQFDILADTVPGNNFSYLPGSGSTTESLPRCIATSRAGLDGCATQSAVGAELVSGTTSGGYVYGGVMYTGFPLNETGAVSYAFGVLMLPQPSTSGACVDDSPAGFGVNADYGCSRKLDLAVTTGRDGCAANIRSAFDISSYLEPMLYLRPTTDAYLSRNLTTTTTDASTIPILCDTITVVALNGAEVVHDCSASTGTVTAADFSLNCSGETTTTTQTVVTSTSGTVTTQVVSTTGTVENAVVGVRYTINRTVSAIVSASAQFTVMNTVPSQLLPLALGQTYAVQFTGGTSATTFQRSGNPGYIVGKPVLAGMINTNGTAVTVSSDTINWLYLPQSPSSTLCSDVNTTGTDDRVGIDFAYNMVGGCGIPVTVENFTDTATCTALRAETLAVISRLVNSNDRVGIYGNSDPADPNDWATILDRTPADWGAAYTGTDSNYECTQVLTAMRLELLFAKVGSIDRAQNTVVGARYVPIYRTEGFVCTSFYCDTTLAPATRQQHLQVTFSVAFLDVTETAEGVNEHQPDLIRKLPRNFFYPFD